MGTSLTYEKKTMSIYHEDLEYLRKLQGVTLSEKLRNLIRKDKQNNQFMNQIFDLNKIKKQDFTFTLGDASANCSFDSIWEVVEFMKELSVIMSKEEVLEFMKSILSVYMDCELKDLEPAVFQLKIE